MPVVIHDVEVPLPPPGATGTGGSPTPLTARTLERVLEHIMVRRARLAAY